MAIARTVAPREGAAPEELPPLFDVVDTTHLERVVESAHESVTIEFTYCGYRVTVSGGGRVEIDAVTDRRPEIDV